jgi:hypothetical protein
MCLHPRSLYALGARSFPSKPADALTRGKDDHSQSPIIKAQHAAVRNPRDHVRGDDTNSALQSSATPTTTDRVVAQTLFATRGILGRVDGFSQDKGASECYDC